MRWPCHFQIRLSTLFPARCSYTIFCRVAMLIHDLVRHPLHLAFAYAGLPLYRSRITRNDAPASVRQAYTVAEMRSFLEKAGAALVDINQQYFFRMGAIAWKEHRS